MERRPKWPIALGLVLWSGAGVLAYYDLWWPLIVIAVVSLLPGLGIGAMVLFTRRFKRDAGAMLEVDADNAAASAARAPVAEPPQPRTSGTRTNARTAGRKRPKGGAAGLVLLGAVLASDGCEKIERARAERRARETADDGGADEPPSAAPASGSSAAPAAPGPVRPPDDPALAAALAGAITPPRPGEATWEVDPFVAALIFERVRTGAAPRFEPLTAPIPEGPTAGFRVDVVEDDSLMHRLGLRSGDVIEAIGGVMLTDAGRVGFALDGAQNRVDVTVFRDGMSVVQRYKLTTGLAWASLLAGFTGDGPAAVTGDTAIADATAGDDVQTADVGGGPTPSPGGGSTPSPGGGGTPGGGSTKPGGGTPGGGSAKPGGGTPGGGTPGGGSTPTPGGGSASDPVQCESAARCTITKAYFDKMVGSPSALQSQATIVPAIQNDVHSGYKLKSVKAGSSVAKLGFRAGDKITHINGSDLTDEFQAAALYMGLSGTSVFKIRYVRGGGSAVKTVVVK